MILALAAAFTLQDAYFQTRQLTLQQAPRISLEAKYGRELERRLGPFASWMSLPGFTASQMSAEIRSRLRSGQARDLVMGESHAVDEELASGRLFMKELLDEGFKLKALLREKHTYEDASDVEARGLKVLTMRNQFRPAPDVDAALRERGRILAAYSGNVHTADRLSAYFVKTLEDGRTWGGKDMPTVEGALLDRRRKPVIVAMMPEWQFLEKIMRLSVRDMLADAPALPDLVQRLEAFCSVWTSRLGRGVNGSLRFIQTPEQDNLFIGLTPSERSPVMLEEALKVLKRPDVSAWAGADPIRLVESLRGTHPNEADQVCTFHEIHLHKKSGEKLSRRIYLEQGWACSEPAKA